MFQSMLGHTDRHVLFNETIDKMQTHTYLSNESRGIIDFKMHLLSHDIMHL